MDIEIVPLMMVVGGSVLLYGAIKNKNPIDVVKNALTGKSLASARPLNSAAAGNPGAGPGSIPGTQLPGTPQKDGDARTDPPGFDPNRDSVVPILPGEGARGSGVL